jgi:trk system potassium uptake protein TrkH
MTINLRVVSRHLGLLLMVLAGIMLLVAVFAGWDRLRGVTRADSGFLALCLSAGLTLGFGGVLFTLGRSPRQTLGQREAVLLVALSWLLAAALAALPYRFWAAFRVNSTDLPHSFDRFAACYFEAMSGFTGTGATVVERVADLPRGLLFWRALSQWLGGVGIVVLYVAILPALGVGGRRMYARETPGLSKEVITPRIQDAARSLWVIYTGLTVAGILALMLLGLGWFDAVCHTFAGVATGGFGTHDNNIGAFPSTAVHLVLATLVILSGVNFSLYYQIVQGSWRRALRDSELHLYLFLLGLGTAVVTLVLVLRPPTGTDGAPVYSSLAVLLRDAFFSLVSVHTTTGFVTADFDTWAAPAKAALLCGMLIGGCAGSTACGIKVVRVLIAAKVVWAEIEQVYRPRVVRSIKIGSSALDADLRLDALIYVLAIGLSWAAGTLLLMLSEIGTNLDVTTAASAAATTLSGCGPGFGGVGPTRNFAWFNDLSKIVMSGLMVLGRLEIFTVAVLLSRRYWRGD